MKDSMKNAVLSIMLTFCLLSNSGCLPLIIGTPVGAGTMTFIQGEVVLNVDASVDEASQVSMDALKEMNIFIFNSAVNPNETTINGEFVDGEKVRLIIEFLSEETSKIKVRVGITGEQEPAKVIMEKIIQKI